MHTESDSHTQGLNGACHCGQVRWRIEVIPESATACNCTVCRRYGCLWAYGHEDDDVTVSGITSAYGRNNRVIDFNFCPTCGCVAYWRANFLEDDGRRRIAVNLRLAEPEPVYPLLIDHFEGLDSFEDLPRDGRCVKDMWF